MSTEERWGWDMIGCSRHLILPFLIVVHLGTYTTSLISDFTPERRVTEYFTWLQWVFSIVLDSLIATGHHFPDNPFSNSVHFVTRLVTPWVVWWRIAVTWGQGTRAPLLLGRNLSGLGSVAISSYGDISRGVWKGEIRPWCFSDGYKVPEFVGEKFHEVLLGHRFSSAYTEGTRKSTMLSWMELLLATVCLLVLGVHVWVLVDHLLTIDVPPTITHPLKFRTLHYLFHLAITWVNFVS